MINLTPNTTRKINEHLYTVGTALLAALFSPIVIEPA